MKILVPTFNNGYTEDHLFWSRIASSVPPAQVFCELAVILLSNVLNVKSDKEFSFTVCKQNMTRSRPSLLVASQVTLPIWGVDYVGLSIEQQISKKENDKTNEQTDTSFPI